MQTKAADSMSNSGQDFEACLTIDEVLGYLKVTSRTIYRLIRSGDLPAMRVGRQWRFRRQDLDAWIERQRHSSPRTDRL
jgi:excisionase family DNA binding protein